MKDVKLCECCGRENTDVVCCSGYRNWNIDLAKMTYAKEKGNQPKNESEKS